MKFLVLACCFFICNCYLFAQNGRYTVKAGEEIRDAISPRERFRYPQFLSGSVYLKDGTYSTAFLNLNLLNQEMQFITPNGDTLSVDNEATIKYIAINTDTFYYYKGFLELVAGNAAARLAKKQRLKVGDVKKMGAYGQASSTSAITSVTSIQNAGTVTKIGAGAELLLLSETIYYIGNSYNYFLVANKKNVMKMFGQHEQEITDFLRENKTRFNDEDDLKLLVGFLQKLP